MCMVKNDAERTLETEEEIEPYKEREPREMDEENVQGDREMFQLNEVIDFAIKCNNGSATEKYI